VTDWECTSQAGKRVTIPAEYANKIFMIIYKQLKIKVKMENKQTAVQWLVKYLSERGYIQAPSFGHSIIDKAIKQAKQMEKQQISDAWENGFMSTAEGWNGEITPEMYNETLDTEKYYNEQYRR
jgi:hypothetical protein